MVAHQSSEAYLVCHPKLHATLGGRTFIIIIFPQAQCVPGLLVALRLHVISTNECMIPILSLLFPRCNVSQEQRKEFVALCLEQGAGLHAVVLRPGLQRCQQRVADRVGHPTLPPGSKAKGIVIMVGKG